MGHALPKALLGSIIARAKGENRDFLLWSEVMDPNRSKQAKDEGFDFISGDTWGRYPELETNFIKLMDELSRLAIPMMASLETPDTPRAALRYRDKRLLYALTMFNALLPNTLPSINAGQECAELQPMNLGLDNTTEGQYVLPENDAMYGKLAFFDNAMLHWNQLEKALMQCLKDARRIRKQYALAFDKRPEQITNCHIVGFKIGNLIVALNCAESTVNLKFDCGVLCVYEHGFVSRRIDEGVVKFGAYELKVLEEL